MHSAPLEQSSPAQIPVQIRVSFTIDIDGETRILSSSLPFEPCALRRGVGHLAGTWGEEPQAGEVWELTGTNPATTDEGRVRFEYATCTRVYPSAVQMATLPEDDKGLITMALRAKAEGDNARAAEAAQARETGVRRLAATFTRQAAQARLLADRIEEHGLMLGEVVDG